LERYEKLFQVGAIAERDLEQMRWNARAAESQLADAQARLTMAEKQLEDARVRAPFAGVVSARTVSEGDVVQPGAPLFVVIDPSSMRYEASVPAAQLVAVRVGAAVFFRVSGYPDRAFKGRVVRVSPVAEQSTGQVRVTVAVANVSGALVGGLFADGKIAAEVHNGLVAPLAAIDARGVRPAVLKLKGGVVERQEVQLGVRDEAGERIELLSGVVAGDTLLLAAAHAIAPGSAVRVVSGDTPQRKE
jgi:RND family efflux transporter MFP subunit